VPLNTSRLRRNDSRLPLKDSRVPLNTSRGRRDGSRVPPNDSRLPRNDFPSFQCSALERNQEALPPAPAAEPQSHEHFP